MYKIWCKCDTNDGMVGLPHSHKCGYI